MTARFSRCSHSTLRRSALLAVGLCASVLFVHAEAAGQVIIRGRVEDAATRLPLEGVRVLNSASTVSVYSDSAGLFTIELPPEDSLALKAERLGYLSQHFELSADAGNLRSVLLLEPAPLEVEGVTVISEAAITQLNTNITRRRNGFGGAMVSMDREWLDRFAPVGVAYDVVRRRMPRIRPCRSDSERICVPGRSPTPDNPYPEIPYTVCIDSWSAQMHFTELGILPLESVSLIEIFHGDARQIRVYTPGWIAHRARIGWTSVTPLWMGC